MSYVDNRALSAVCSSHPFGCVFKFGALKSFQPIRVPPIQRTLSPLPKVPSTWRVFIQFSIPINKKNRHRT